ncbi:MAG: hypothetical protein ACRDQE_09970 [Gaiellales bacterium]
MPEIGQKNLEIRARLSAETAALADGEVECQRRPRWMPTALAGQIWGGHEHSVLFGRFARRA